MFCISHNFLHFCLVFAHFGLFLPVFAFLACAFLVIFKLKIVSVLFSQLFATLLNNDPIGYIPDPPEWSPGEAPVPGHSQSLSTRPSRDLGRDMYSKITGRPGCMAVPVAVPDGHLCITREVRSRVLHRDSQSPGAGQWSGLGQV